MKFTLQSHYATHKKPTNKTEQKAISIGGVRRMNLEVSQPEESSCSGVWWYGSRYFISCQTAAG